MGVFDILTVTPYLELITGRKGDWLHAPVSVSKIQGSGVAFILPSMEQLFLDRVYLSMLAVGVLST